MALLAKVAKGERTTLSPEFTASLRYALRGEGGPTGVQSAIICGDVSAPRDPELYWRDIERGRAAHPLFGPLADNINLCAFWDRDRTCVQRNR